MTLNGVMAITLRYFTKFGKYTFQHVYNRRVDLWRNLCTSLQCESKKSSPPKTFCDIFICGKHVQLKITVAIAQTYCYIYTNCGPFI